MNCGQLLPGYGDGNRLARYLFSCKKALVERYRLEGSNMAYAIYTMTFAHQKQNEQIRSAYAMYTQTTQPNTKANE
jgi:hypothetical protein